MARSVVKKDPGESLLFASVLCEHQEHDAEATILLTAAEATKGHSLFHGLFDTLQILHGGGIRNQSQHE